ncbi:MAG: fibronectin type III domain-containing protein, partial [Coprococcus sp.]
KRGTNSIKFTWNKVSGADGYYIYRLNRKTGKYSRIKDITSGQITTFVSSKLKSGTTYTYKVYAYKKIGTSKIAGKAGVFRNTTLPATPVISIVARSKKAVVGWEKISGANGYQIYMSTSKNGKYKKVATLKGANKVRYTKSNLESGKTYYFKIKAYRTYKGKRVYSSYSTIKKVKVK